jgi:hypothetical protein
MNEQTPSPRPAEDVDVVGRSNRTADSYRIEVGDETLNFRSVMLTDPEHLTAANLHLLDGVTFAFLSMDAGEPKRHIVEKLESLNTSFIDVGMGMGLDGGALAGMLRVTASTPDRRDLFRDKVSFTGGGVDDVYASNIQVADPLGRDRHRDHGLLDRAPEDKEPPVLPPRLGRIAFSTAVH